MTAALLGAILLAATATAALASPIKFNFTFAGGGATAKGFVVFESTLLSNPGSNSFILPNPAVLDVQVTVSGAAAGNGTFGIASFGEVFFDTHGATLNLGKELVGQPTPGSPWGTPDSHGGDCCFGASAPAPNNIYYFTLGANGGRSGESMVLQTMAPVVLSVPALDDWSRLALALMVGGAGVVLIRRRHSARLPG